LSFTFLTKFIILLQNPVADKVQEKQTLQISATLYMHSTISSTLYIDAQVTETAPGFNHLHELLIGCTVTTVPSRSEYPFIGPEPACGISVGAAKKAIRDWTNRNHNKHWQSITGLKQVKGLIQGPSARRTKDLLNRNQLRWVVGLFTGHCHLKGCLFKLGPTEDTCERCLEKAESATHILYDCEAIAYLRFRHLGQFFIKPSDYYDTPLNKVLYFI
jgi:hypothetical protein